MGESLFGNKICDICGRQILTLPDQKTGDLVTVELKPMIVFTRNLNGTLCQMEAHQHHSVRCKKPVDDDDR